MRVLIVDDNQDVTDLLSKFLNSKGIENVVSNDPLEGLTKIKQEKFDKVLLDISMPDFSGIDIIHTLEREKKLQEQKIVIFSAVSFTDREVHDSLQKDGVQLCLKKPIKLDKVLTAVAS